jgi:hypothetical protein
MDENKDLMATVAEDAPRNEYGVSVALIDETVSVAEVKMVVVKSESEDAVHIVNEPHFDAVCIQACGRVLVLRGYRHVGTPVVISFGQVAAVGVEMSVDGKWRSGILVVGLGHSTGQVYTVPGRYKFGVASPKQSDLKVPHMFSIIMWSDVLRANVVVGQVVVEKGIKNAEPAMPGKPSVIGPAPSPMLSPRIVGKAGSPVSGKRSSSSGLPSVLV